MKTMQKTTFDPDADFSNPATDDTDFLRSILTDAAVEYIRMTVPEKEQSYSAAAEIIELAISDEPYSAYELLRPLDLIFSETERKCPGNLATQLFLFFKRICPESRVKDIIKVTYDFLGGCGKMEKEIERKR